MKILIYDRMQETDAPDEIKSPSLADKYDDDTEFDIDYDDPITIDCIGVGYTDATQFYIASGGGSIQETISITQEYPFYNGLYLLSEALTSDQFTISHNGNYVGRVAIGEYIKLGTAPTKEIGFYSTAENRVTLSGQVIPGSGGYFGRRVGVTVPHKIDSDVYDAIYNAYEEIKRNYPFFIRFDDEEHKFPSSLARLYANTKKPLSMLQSSSYQFKYSYRFDFYERF